MHRTLIFIKILNIQLRLFRTEGKFPERPGFDAVIVYRKKRVEQYTSNGILPGKGEDWYRKLITKSIFN